MSCLAQPSPALADSAPPPCAEVTNAGKCFGKFAALAEVTFTLGAGQILACVGRNGAGKTTLIRLLTGVLAPTSGQVRVYGQNPYLDSFLHRRDFGLLLENNGLYDKCPVDYNLELYARLYGLPRREIPARIAEVLELVQLQDCLKKRVDTLSKGMKQRVALARSIIHRPKFLLLDEPTSGLDPESIDLIHSHLKSLAAREGATIFYTSHNLDEVERISDTMLVLRSGRLMFSGRTPDFLASSETLRLRFFSGEDYAGALAVFAGNGGSPLKADPDRQSVTLRSHDDNSLHALLEKLRSHGIHPLECARERNSLFEEYIKAMREEPK